MQNKTATKNGRVALLKEHLVYLENNSTCPTCEQSCSSSIKRSAKNTLQDLIVELENLDISSIKVHQSKLNALKKLEPLKIRLSDLQTELEKAKVEMKSYQTSLGKISQELHPLAEKRDELKKQIASLEHPNFVEYYSKKVELEDVVENLKGSVSSTAPEKIDAENIKIQEKKLSSLEQQLEERRKFSSTLQMQVQRNLKEQNLLKDRSADVIKTKAEMDSKKLSLKESKDNMSKLISDIASIKERIQPLRIDLEEKTGKLEQVQDKKEKVEEMHRMITQWADQSKTCKENNYFKIYTSLKNADSKDEQEGLDNKKSSLKQAKHDLDSLLDKKEQISKAINCMKDEKWTLERQITYCKLKAKLSTFKNMDVIGKKLKKADREFNEHTARLMELNEKIIQREDRIQ